MIGIDLGTTNSLVAVLREDGPVVLANEFNESLTPSAVAVAEDGTVLVGRPDTEVDPRPPHSDPHKPSGKGFNPEGGCGAGRCASPQPPSG